MNSWDALGLELKIDGKVVGERSRFFRKHATLGPSRDILRTMIRSDHLYEYGEGAAHSVEYLIEELEIRRLIVKAGTRFRYSGIRFLGQRGNYDAKVSKKARSRNWKRVGDAIKTKKPSAGLDELFDLGSEVRMECNSALQLIYLVALRDYLGRSKFDSLFPAGLILGANSTSPMPMIGEEVHDFLAGDWRYYANPNYDEKEHPHFQGENVLQMGMGNEGLFGHPGAKYPNHLFTERQWLEILNRMTKIGPDGRPMGGARPLQDRDFFDMDRIIKLKKGE